MSRICLLCFLVIACTRVSAQSYTGYDVSSYTGVYGTLFNPANILDRRVRADISLYGFSIGIQNNVLLIDASDKENGVKVPNPIKRMGRGGMLYDLMGPGFMLRLNDRNAISVTTRARAQGNADRLDNNLLNILLQDDPPYLPKRKSN